MNNIVFVNAVQEHINCLSSLIDNEMLDTGDKEYESQKICLINRLFEFQSTINAVMPDDMKVSE